MGVSIRKNVDLEKCVDEVTTAQMTIVGNDDVFFVVSLLVPRTMQYWSTFRAKFDNEDLSWLADRMHPFVPNLFQTCLSLRGWS